MSTVPNYRYVFPLIVICILMPFAHSALSQIYVDDTLFVGNNDGSAFHAPYQGVVDIPLWLKIIYKGSTGVVNLITPNYAVSERLDGNLYYPWPFTFYPPTWYPDYSLQRLLFTAEDPPDSVGHFADFTIRMALDASYINDTLQLMYANAQFCDSTGYVLIYYEVRVSQVVIDDITAVDEDISEPKDIIVSRIYPNPFNSSTIIEYDLPEAERVKIDIYDLLGRRIVTLVDEEKRAGQHQMIWDASQHSSGVYFYRIEIENFTETKKMVLLK